MKNLLLSFVFLFVSLSVSAQNSTFNDLLNSLQSDRIGVITTVLTENVDLILPGNEKTVSESEATREINSFFKRYPKSDFEVLHYSNKENSSFIISKYTSGDNQFRMYLLLKKLGDKVQISQIRIEKTKE